MKLCEQLKQWDAFYKKDFCKKILNVHVCCFLVVVLFIYLFFAVLLCLHAHTEVSDFTIVVTNSQNQPIATLVRVFSTDTGVLLLIVGGHKNFKSYELLGSSIVTC